MALTDADQTERLGAALASSLRWSATAPLVMYLHGELGSGKTTLARGVLRELGVEGNVRSPTYTLLESYEPQGHRVLHLDLYRLRDSADLAPLGLRDELIPGTLLLIEWPERAEDRLPPPDLKVRLSAAPQGRVATLASSSPAGASWLERLPARAFPESKRI